MCATPGFVSPLRTAKTSTSDEIIPLPMTVGFGVVAQRAMTMSGDFLVRSSQPVNGEMITAIAVPTATNKTIIAESCFMFIGRGCSIFRSRPDCWVRRCSAASVSRRSEEHTSELQSLAYLVCRLLLEKKKKYVH